jgi:hypothetical protein
MVGNLFYLNDDDLIENQHIYEGIAIHKITGEDIHMCEIDNEAFNMFYKPIPITEELLVDKFGFEEDDDLFTFDKFTILPKGFRQGYIQGRVYLNNYKVDTYVPEYIHQLQNLYSILEQKELEIQ